MIGDLRLTIGFKLAALALLLSTMNHQPSTCFAFERRIAATITRGGQAENLLYTVGTNFLRVEMVATNWPNPVDILDIKSGALTLLFPHNRSFVRLKPATEHLSTPPGFPQMPAGLPPGVGPQSRPPGVPAMPNNLPPGIGPTNLPGMPAMPNSSAMPVLPAGLSPGVGPQAQPSTIPGAPAIPAMPNMPAAGAMPSMPPMPMMPMEKMELKSTGEKTNLLGFACEKFEIKQRGEMMEIWATEGLLPFQNYVRNQPPRFGPRMIEEQWGELVRAKKLFPLLAVLRFAPPQIPGAAGGQPPARGPERFRFEVTSVTPQKLTDEEAELFQPPTNYFEIQPLPF
jgi:hypothetical protein